MDYTDINLNEYLQPMNTPISNAGAVSAYDFDASNERGAISASFIQSVIAGRISGTLDASLVTVENLSMNSLEGGTLDVGGTTNKHGVWQVKNESGAVVAQATKDGLDVRPTVVFGTYTAGTPSDAWAIYCWNNGTSYSFKTRMDSGDWSIDQTAG